MDFPRLSTFVRVAESGSFNKAGELGNITSTAVIKQMNLLEEEVGVKLFDRTQASPSSRMCATSRSTWGRRRRGPARP